MRFKKVTKNSVRLVSDEHKTMEGIRNSARRLAEGYELQLVTETFIAAMEVYLDTNIGNQERAIQVREIFEVFDAELAKL